MIEKSAADPTPEEASRFLMQATFGPKESEITALDNSNFDTWLNTQFAKPRVSHYDYIWNLRTQGVDVDNFSNNYAIESFWKQAITGDDQLRQRVTWGLSQIFVVGEQDNARNSTYYDLLAENAFGNYRTLLEKVTLSPAMGQWLSHIGNQKEDVATGRLPDENYAREVMQLFSIGLWQLNADGTRKLDANNQPIPTYTQDDIRGMAKVLTGWSYANCNPAQEPWYCIDSARNGWYRIYDNVDTPAPLPLVKTEVYRDVTKQMTAMAAYHSTSEKKIVGGITLPAGRTAELDLKDGLDALFNHPNVGPFFGRQLIQRLVKSNPTPAYVGRVSAVFANNGQGVRGDLKAVIRAILLDPEARDVTQATTTTSGKLREPILRLAHYLRAFTVPDGATPRYDMNPWWMDEVFAQRPLSSKSVFNFYSPGYAPPGEMATNNLVGPEFQIYNESTLVDSHNFIEYWVTNDPSTDTDPGHVPSFKHNYAAYTALASNPTALVDKLNLILTSNTMSPEARTSIITAVTNVPAGTNQARDRFTMALMLFEISPDYLIQK